MFVIRESQLDAIRAAQGERFIDDAARRLGESWPQRIALLGPAGFRTVVEQVIADALALGFTEDADVLRYANIAIALGRDFATNPSYPWAKKILSSALPLMTRISLLNDETYRELASRTPQA